MNDMYFNGDLSMKGHGLGAIFSNLFRRAVPFLKSGLGYLGKEALGSGVNTLNEIIDGVPAKRAFKNNMRKMKDKVMGDIKVKLNGGGRKGKKRKRKSKVKNTRKKIKKTSKGSSCVSRIMLY